MIRTDQGTDEEIRFELARLGLDEFTNRSELRILLEDRGYVSQRAGLVDPERTEEQRIAFALDGME